MPAFDGRRLAAVVSAAALLCSFARAEQPFVNKPEAGLVKYAAWSVLAKDSGGIATVVGSVKKHPKNPLLVQDRPWDARWDNGYPNIEHTPGSLQGRFQLWYGGFVSCHGPKCKGVENAWHFANSSDGLAWEKPDLGITDLAKARGATPAMIAAGRRNNVLLLRSDGMGLLLDKRDPNRSRAFKSVGTGCFSQSEVTDCISGSAVSADGLRWTGAEPIRFPSPHAWDDHQNFFFDSALGRYVLTTRLKLRANAASEETLRDNEDYERAIAISLGAQDGTFGGWSTPLLTMRGNALYQLYSQVTWPYYNVYLGIVMVFDTQAPTTVGTVRCRLAWAQTPEGPWNWVAADGLTGPELPPISGPDTDAFDSHICFAAHRPLTIGGRVWLYYMGGNGPHNGARNSSLGLATLRPDGFAGIGPAAASVTRVSTMPITVTGEALIVTADITASGGFVRLGVAGHPALDPSLCGEVVANTTDKVLYFEGGAGFEGLLGHKVVLELVLHRAVLYTFGFSRQARSLLV